MNKYLSLFVAAVILCAQIMFGAWQPGLHGGAIQANTLQTTGWPAVTNVYTGPLMTTISTVPPWEGNTTWVYWGEIFLDGSTYWFAENIDDGVYLTINGVVVLNNIAWSTPSCGSITLPSGWYPIEIRVFNGGGGAGPVSAYSWTSTKGFGFKIGGTSSIYGSAYTYPNDTGDGTLFHYDDGKGFDNSLTIQGTPSPYGNVVPPYGQTNGLEVGDSLICSVENPEIEINGTRNVCTGYVWTVSGATNDTLHQTGNETSFTYTHCEGGSGTVTWLWTQFHKMNFSANDGGTVSETAEWTGDGETVTVSAIPDEGWIFTCWVGDINDNQCYEQNIEFVATKPMTAKAVFSRADETLVYVRPDGDDTADGTSWSTAKQHLEEVVATAEDNAIIMLGHGTYLLTNECLTLSRPLTLCGASAENTIISAKESGSVCDVLRITNPDARVYGLSIANGKLAASTFGHNFASGIQLEAGIVSNCIVRDCVGGDNGGVTISGGLLTDCVITGNTAKRPYSSGVGRGGGICASGGVIERCMISNNASAISGAGVYITGDAVVRDCVIANNKHTDTSVNNGLGVYMMGGTVERCLIENNTDAGIGGGAYINGASAVMRNCIIRRNTAMTAGGGVQLEKGTLLNCTVTENTTVSKTSMGFSQTGGLAENNIFFGNGTVMSLADAQDASVTGGVFTNNCIAQELLLESGNINADPLFTDAAGGDYTLMPGSPCRDAGLDVEGLTDDFNGTARPLDGDAVPGAANDIGAFEAATFDSCPLSCGFVVTPEEGTDSLSATFTAVVAGADLEGLWYGWDFGNDGTFDAYGASAVWEITSSGIFDARLVVSNASNQTASAIRQRCVRIASNVAYVSLNGSNVSPYLSWETAAHNVQDALDAVLSTDDMPGTVYVAAGTYEIPLPTLTINRPVKLISADGPENTILKAKNLGGERRVISVNHEKACVSGFTMTDGYVNSFNSSALPSSGALYLTAGVVTNCIIRDNWGADNAGGVLVNDGLITDCKIYNNKAHRNNNSSIGLGGGISLNNGTIERCIISNNVAFYVGSLTDVRNGSGIFMKNGVVRDCIIADNHTGNSGKGIGCGICVLGGFVERCVISGNNNGMCGGGLAMDNVNAVVQNCLIKGNSTFSQGGGVYVKNGTLLNCTVVDNTSLNFAGSGLYQTGGTVSGCILVGNTGDPSADATCNVRRDAGVFSNNCLMPELLPELGNINADPLFTDSPNGDYTLTLSSPCVDAISATSVTNDIVGNIRPKDGNGDGVTACDIGAYEAPDANEGEIRCSFLATPTQGQDSLDVQFTASVGGSVSGPITYYWDFDGDGVTDISADDQNIISQTFGLGLFDITLTVSNGAAGSSFTIQKYIKISSKQAYVSTNGSAEFPYDTREKAAHSIQEAIDALVLLDGVRSSVIVTDGTYDIDSLWLFVKAPIHIISENGPETTILRAANPGQTTWRRILAVDNPEALIAGFTMTDGSVLNNMTDGYGPGALRLISGTVSNCWIKNNIGADVSGGVEIRGGLLVDSVVCSNKAYRSNNANVGTGGGVTISGGTMRKCHVFGNTAYVGGGGVYVNGNNSLVTDCLIENNVVGKTGMSDRTGGGIFINNGTADRCVIRGNSAYGKGAGATIKNGLLSNSLLVHNISSTGIGHGATLTDAAASMVNCTVTDNGTSLDGSGVSISAGTVINSIFSFNATADVASTGGMITYSCWPEASGEGNISGDPCFVGRDAGDYRITSSSPCANAGSNVPWDGIDALDLLGGPRVILKHIDIGAIESIGGGATRILIQ